MQRRNNFLIGVILVAAVFLSAILMDWFHFNGGFSATGRNGGIGLPGTFKPPIWLLLGLSAAATVVMGLNFVGVTSIWRSVLAVLLVSCGVYYALPFFPPDGPVSYRIEEGPYIALAATLAALGLLCVRAPKSPGSTPRMVVPPAA